MTTAAQIISEYKSQMYVEPGEDDDLQTGDVLLLRLEDFKKLVRHQEILGVFEAYERNPAYASHFWAVLNQPCDLVHDPSNDRVHKSNLFLAPLQGLKSALKRGNLGSLLHVAEVKGANKAFKESYQKYLRARLEIENPFQGGQDKGEYYKKLNQSVERVLGSLESLLSSAEDVEDPAELLAAMKECLSEQPELVQDLENFEKSTDWLKKIEVYRKALEEAEKTNSKIILKASVANNKISDLCLNQLDSLGVFFYEPHPRISFPQLDLAYIIRLEDFLTVKLNLELQSGGEAIKILKNARHISLKENFADRLLNIMGNYFSKIGTADVKAPRVLELYRTVYPEEFFTDPIEFEAYAKLQHATKSGHLDSLPVPSSKGPTTT